MNGSDATLEDSNGKIIQNPTSSDISIALGLIGAGSDHCILDMGSDKGFVQVAGDRKERTLQYRDSTGMYEGHASDWDLPTLQRVFVSSMRGDFSWKSEYSFDLIEASEAPHPDLAATSRKEPTAGAKSLADELLDAVKSESLNKLKGFVRGGLGGLFGKK